MRYQDPEGDYGRQKRQREVIKKVVEKVLSLNSISHYQAILKAVSSNMQTNIELTSGSIPQLLGYRDAFKNIESQQLRGEDATLADGGSYQIVTKNHLLEMQNILRKSLGLEILTKLETNAVLYEDLNGEGQITSGSSNSSGVSNVYPSTVTDTADTGTAYSTNSYSNPTPNNSTSNISPSTTVGQTPSSATTTTVPEASSDAQTTN